MLWSPPLEMLQDAGELATAGAAVAREFGVAEEALSTAVGLQPACSP